MPLRLPCNSLTSELISAVEAAKELNVLRKQLWYRVDQPEGELKNWPPREKGRPD